MIVEFVGGIEAAHGTFCKNKNGSRVIVTTRRNASSKKNSMRMYIRSAESYQRTNPPSEAEVAARDLFTRRQARVQELISSGKCRSKAEAWKIAKIEIIS